MECPNWDKLSIYCIIPDLVKRILGTKLPNWQKLRELEGIKY